MQKNYDDIGDDEVRFLGCDEGNQDSGSEDKKLGNKSRVVIRHFVSPKIGAITPVFIAIIVVVAVLLICLLNYSLRTAKPNDDMTSPEPGYCETAKEQVQHPDVGLPLTLASETGYGFIEIADAIINDIPMRLYLPHHVSVLLQLGTLDRGDSSIIFAAQAADVRADNGGIVGAFVLKGEPKAWGLSKKGFCAIINDTVTVGVADNSPLFEEATEKEGYFFRQFPLVHNGQLVENEQRGKSIRRALCDRNGEIFTVETLSAESFHDFAQALADLGVDQAIYLVGSDAYGWATDAEGQRHEFGNPDPPKKKWENISYLVMRNKD